MRSPRKLDRRLAALVPVIHEFEALSAFLARVDPAVQPHSVLSSLCGSDPTRPTYWRAMKWIDDAVAPIKPHLHARRWPPVWWRLRQVDFKPVFRNVRWADANGWFFGEPTRGENYIPERPSILAWIDGIEGLYEEATKVRT